MVPQKNGRDSAKSRRLNFTKKSIDVLECPLESKQIYYLDTQVRGLCMSVSRSGNKAFVLRRKIDGRSERILLGQYPDMSIENARKAAYEKNAQISGGINPGDLRRDSKGEPTLGDLFAEYLKRHASKKRKTSDIMQKDFDRYLSQWKGRKCSSISNRDVEELHHRMGHERGRYVANRTVQLLRAVYNRAIAWGLFVKENPAKGITLFPEKSRERFLSKEEATHLLKALERECNDNLRDFIKLSFLTGVRKSNLMSIRWDWIDLKSHTLVIPDTKNGTKQTVPLGIVEVGVLRERFKRLETEAAKRNKEVSPFVFPGIGADGHMKDLKRAWTTFKSQIGLEDITIHDLRRSLASTMANANTNLSLIKSALHHKDMKTTLSVYARSQDDAVRDAKLHALLPILQDAGLVKKRNSKRTRR